MQCRKSGPKHLLVSELFCHLVHPLHTIGLHHSGLRLREEKLTSTFTTMSESAHFVSSTSSTPRSMHIRCTLPIGVMPCGETIPFRTQCLLERLCHQPPIEENSSSVSMLYLVPPLVSHHMPTMGTTHLRLASCEHSHCACSDCIGVS